MGEEAIACENSVTIFAHISSRISHDDIYIFGVKVRRCSPTPNNRDISLARCITHHCRLPNVSVSSPVLMIKNRRAAHSARFRKNQPAASRDAYSANRVGHDVSKKCGFTGVGIAISRELVGLNCLGTGNAELSFTDRTVASRLFRVAVCGLWPTIQAVPYFQCVGHVQSSPRDEPSFHVAIPVGNGFPTASVTPKGYSR